MAKSTSPTNTRSAGSDASRVAAKSGMKGDPVAAKRKPKSLREHPPNHEAIAVAAYYRAERRGFEPGAELQDWLAAERELVRGS